MAFMGFSEIISFSEKSEFSENIRSLFIGQIYASRSNRQIYFIADKKEVEILSLEIMPDHIHLFVSSPPQHSASLLINWFKGISSRMYNYWYNEVHIKWTNSYHVGTAGTVTADLIIFENLNISGMLKNHNLAKHIQVHAWGKLIQFTQSKAAKAGKVVELVAARYTSQKCSQCGILVPKTLANRVHHCPKCGLEMNRDLNAGINILTLGLRGRASRDTAKAGQ